MRDIWFIRHGESTANAGGVTFDTTTVELTELGHRQAQDVSFSFDRAPDLVVMTPYLRTQQTAHYTLQRFPDVPQEIWQLHELRCLSHANYRGTTQAQRAPLVRAYWHRRDPSYHDGEGAETFTDFVSRIEMSLEKLKMRPEKFIAIFCHGHVMRVMRLLLARPQLSPADIMELMLDHSRNTPVQNCEIMRLSVKDKKIELHPDDLSTFEERFNPSPQAICR